MTTQIIPAGYHASVFVSSEHVPPVRSGQPIGRGPLPDAIRECIGTFTAAKAAWDAVFARMDIDDMCEAGTVGMQP